MMRTRDWMFLFKFVEYQSKSYKKAVDEMMLSKDRLIKIMEEDLREWKK